MMKKFNLGFFTQLAVLLVIWLSSTGVVAQKIRAEEIVSKHLDSIGPTEVREKLKNQVTTGQVQYTVLRKGTGGGGRIVFASEANKLVFGMTFSIPSYPAETFIFDGKKTKVAFAISNTRSEFGDFVYRYKDVLSEGLFGGTLVSNWTLIDLSSRKAKVDFDGTKKIDDREVYVLSYLPKGGSDLQITIYIDKQNFQHLRTQYKRVISSIQGPNPDASAQQRVQLQTLIEDFSDYAVENGLSLPHSYRVYVMLSGAEGTREYEYRAKFTEFMINQQLDPNSFSVEAK